jgi:hypothetical protein
MYAMQKSFVAPNHPGPVGCDLTDIKDLFSPLPLRPFCNAADLPEFFPAVLISTMLTIHVVKQSLTINLGSILDYF